MNSIRQESTTAIPFEKFEKAVMEKLLEKETSINKVLREQYKNASVVSRKFTGVGFFTDFNVPKNIPPVMEPVAYGYGNVSCIINGIENCGFVLFIKEGVMICLEGYTFMDKWPEVITSYHLEESNPKIIII